MLLEDFEQVPSVLSTDGRGRIEIGTEQKDYTLGRNGAGQILLTPIAPPDEDH